MAGISCPSCGGKMVFHIPDQNLKCPFCGTSKEVKDYTQENAAEQHKEIYNTMVYTCRNCGAELLAPDEQTVAYCSYCGSEAMLEGKYEDVIRPKTIIPFQKSKKQAKNEYEKALKGKLFVPKEFKDADFLEGFRGVYLPYYSYEAMVPDRSLSLTGSKKYTKGSYDYSETYDIHADVGGVARGVKYDASVAFDDTIANEIAPFSSKGERSFSDAYLAGFYADKATTAVSTYIEDATEDALDSIYASISKQSGDVKISEYKKLEEKKAEIGIDSFNCEVTMYPVWFLTWRNKNRVAYSVMNGQTGKLAMDIPVDKKKFFLLSLAAAAVIFIILSLLPMFILPKTLSLLAAIILAVSSIFLNQEITQIFNRENHVYDYGDTSHAVRKKRIKAKTEEKKQKKSGGLGCVFLVIAIFGVYMIGGIITLIEMLVQGVNSAGAHTFFYVAALIVHLICSVLMFRHGIQVERKTVLIPALFGPLALFFGLIVGIANPIHDYWFYGAALACLVGLVLNSLSAINYFNYLTTRPVPNFFTREGADNGQ